MAFRSARVPRENSLGQSYKYGTQAAYGGGAEKGAWGNTDIPQEPPITNVRDLNKNAYLSSGAKQTEIAIPGMRQQDIILRPRGWHESKEYGEGDVITFQMNADQDYGMGNVAIKPAKGVFRFSIRPNFEDWGVMDRDNATKVFAEIHDDINGNQQHFLTHEYDIPIIQNITTKFGGAQAQKIDNFPAYRGAKRFYKLRKAYYDGTFEARQFMEGKGCSAPIDCGKDEFTFSDENTAGRYLMQNLYRYYEPDGLSADWAASSASQAFYIDYDEVNTATKLSAHKYAIPYYIDLRELGDLYETETLPLYEMNNACYEINLQLNTAENVFLTNLDSFLNCDAGTVTDYNIPLKYRVVNPRLILPAYTVNDVASLRPMPISKVFRTVQYDEKIIPQGTKRTTLNLQYGSNIINRIIIGFQNERRLEQPICTISDTDYSQKRYCVGTLGKDFEKEVPIDHVGKYTRFDAWMGPNTELVLTAANNNYPYNTFIQTTFEDWKLATMKAAGIYGGKKGFQSGYIPSEELVYSNQSILMYNFELSDENSKTASAVDVRIGGMKLFIRWDEESIYSSAEENIRVMIWYELLQSQNIDSQGNVTLSAET